MKDWNEITPLRIILVILGIALLIALLPSCTVYERTAYTTTKHNCELMERGQSCLSDHRCCETQEHSTEVYYYNELPYWGFYSGYYYYYGVPHYYPWWYYYSLRPHYAYNVHTHVHIHCDNGNYVYTPRGNRFNNSKGGTYRPTNVVVKPNKPIHRPNIKVNTNKNNTIIIKPNKNRSNTNIKTNKNRSNTKININKSNTKTNINKSNTNRTNKNRSIKNNNRKPR